MPDVLPLAKPLHVEHIGYLTFPERIDADAAPHGFRPAKQVGRTDAVVLTAAVSRQDLAGLMRELADPLLPVVSLVAARQPRIDTPNAGGESAWARIVGISARLRRLHRSIRYATDLDDVLLAWAYSRDRPLAAAYDDASRDLVSYPPASPARDVAEAALRLYGRGFFTRSFFDRINHCARCRSSRLVVREECSRCRSPNIVEEATVHHFRCGHIAPESHFRADGGLDCPKCRRELRHIGLDYDKPGSITRCEACGHVTDKPVVGFKCVSCEAHHPAEAAPVTTWYSFALTTAGVQRALSGSEDASQPNGPTAFGVLLGHCFREQQEFAAPFAVAMVGFARRDEVMRQDRRLWAESMKLMADVLHSALRSVDVVREEEWGFLVLMPRTDAEEARAAMAHVAKRTGDVLAVDPGVRFELLDEEALRLLRGEAGRP